MPSCMNRLPRLATRWLARLSMAGLLALPAIAPAQTQTDTQQGAPTLQSPTDTTPSGPVRLRQGTQDQRGTLRTFQQTRPPEYKPGEFEEYVQRLVGQAPSTSQADMQAAAQAQPPEGDAQRRA